MKETKVELKKILIVRPCFIDRMKVTPGTILEVKPAFAGGLFHAGKASFDLSLQDAVKKEYAQKAKDKAAFKERAFATVKAEPKKEK